MKLAFLAAAWLAGTMLGLEVDPPLAPVVLLLLALLPLALVFRTFRWSVWPALLAGVLLLGADALQMTATLHSSKSLRPCWQL